MVVFRDDEFSKGLGSVGQFLRDLELQKQQKDASALNRSGISDAIENERELIKTFDNHLTPEQYTDSVSRLSSKGVDPRVIKELLEVYKPSVTDQVSGSVSETASKLDRETGLGYFPPDIRAALLPGEQPGGQSVENDVNGMLARLAEQNQQPSRDGLFSQQPEQNQQQPLGGSPQQLPPPTSSNQKAPPAIPVAERPLEKGNYEQYNALVEQDGVPGKTIPFTGSSVAELGPMQDFWEREDYNPGYILTPPNPPANPPEKSSFVEIKDDKGKVMSRVTEQQIDKLISSGNKDSQKQGEFFDKKLREKNRDALEAYNRELEAYNREYDRYAQKFDKNAETQTGEVKEYTKNIKNLDKIRNNIRRGNKISAILKSPDESASLFGGAPPFSSAVKLLTKGLAGTASMPFKFFTRAGSDAMTEEFHSLLDSLSQNSAEQEMMAYVISLIDLREFGGSNPSNQEMNKKLKTFANPHNKESTNISIMDNYNDENYAELAAAKRAIAIPKDGSVSSKDFINSVDLVKERTIKARDRERKMLNKARKKYGKAPTVPGYTYMLDPESGEVYKQEDSKVDRLESLGYRRYDS